MWALIAMFEAGLIIGFVIVGWVLQRKDEGK